MGILYLLALLVALTGMVMLDRRFHLFFWQDARRATIVLVAGVLFFLAWDVSGISAGIFFRGETSFMTGILVGPELPLEEVFFLTLLCYLTMNLFETVGRMLGRAFANHGAALARGAARPVRQPDPAPEHRAGGGRP